MILHGKLVLKEKIIDGYLGIQDGKVSGISKERPTMEKGESFQDFQDCYIMPGFVDTHTHGSGGFDFMDGTAEDIVGAARSHARFGTTTCLPTALTSSDEEMVTFLKNLNSVHHMQVSGNLKDCAKMPGTHLEGPYFDMVEKGAQDPRYIRDPDPEHYNMLLEAGNGLIKRWSVAPERPGAIEFIDYMVKQGYPIQT